MQELKYPLLLVHGMGFRDNQLVGYWGRIPAKLEEAGCRIFYGAQDANGSIEANAAILAQRVKEIVRQTGAEKLNVIAHSKGGLDMRYAVSKLGIAEHIASLTTISTPHHGSLTVDRLLRFPKPLVRFGSFCADLWLRLLGDRHPDTYGAIGALTTAAAEAFNQSCPDAPGVYYQSYAFVMKHLWSDMLMFIPAAVVNWIEGPNDGLLAPRATQWTNFRGVFTGSGTRGISHCDEVDLRRKRLSRKQGDGVSDIADIYLDIVKDLGCRGF